MLFAILPAAVLLAVGSPAAVADEVSLDVAGEISFKELGLSLKPYASLIGWSDEGGAIPRFVKEGEENNLVREWTVRMRDGLVGRGKVALGAGTNGCLRIGFRYTNVGKPRTYATTMLRGPLSAEVIRGGGWRFDDKRFGRFSDEIPEKKWIHLAVEKTRRLELDLPAIGRHPVFSFDRELTVVIQDGRRSSGTMDIRFIVNAQGKYEKDEMRQFAMTLTDAVAFEPVALRPFRATEGADWVRLDFRKSVLPGSAFDFSRVAGLREAPAGRYGWLKNVGGHFEFEGAAGQVRRFAGGNVCGKGATVPTHAEADEMVRRFVAMGWNSVRIHHHDGPLVEGSPDRLTFNAENLDRFDYLVAKLIENGLYVTTDLQVSRPVNWEDISVPGKQGPMNVTGAFKIFMCFWDPARQNWLAFAKNFMNHVNPYTGRAYKDEPGMPFVSLVNEGSFRVGWPHVCRERVFREHWSAWLAKKGFADIDPVKIEWSKFGDTGSALAATYLAEMTRSRCEWMTREMRALGVKALFTDLNHLPHYAPNHFVREDLYDYVDDHTYLDAPSYFANNAWRDPTILHNADPFGEPQRRLQREPFHRLWGKPFAVSEWQFVGTNPFRSSAGLVHGSLAAGQDWSALWRFAYSHELRGFEDNGRFPEVFDLCTDPIGLLSDRTFALLFLRGDLKPFEPAVTLSMTPQDCVSRDGTFHQLAPVWDVSEGWKARLGVSTPKSVLPAGVRALSFAESVAATRPPYELPFADGISLDRAAGVFSVSTPRLCGGFASNGVVRCGALHFEILRGGPTTLTAHSLDGLPLDRSASILVTHLTDALGKGSLFTDDSRRVQIYHGDGKVTLVRNGEVKVSLETGGPMRVYAIGTDGERLCEVPAVFRDGRLRFTTRVDVCPKTAVLSYELAR